MERSQINEILAAGQGFFQSFGFHLPDFAAWSPERILSPEAEQIRSRGLGWDVTDYGQGKFDDLGLFLFTVRNGSLADLGQGQGMVYAEKIMISRRNQISPMHRHNIKVEDIINRGGGSLILELYGSDATRNIDREKGVTVRVDGVAQTLKAGELLRLSPGQSVTLTTDIWHAFWGEGEDVLIGEVSTVNDDRTDNVFEMDIGRFSRVEEDEPATRLLVSDYESDSFKPPLGIV